MNISKEDLAVRLVEERARLGYSQADMARKAGISREGLRLYETAQRGIAADFLAAVAVFGFDVQYILSGIRSLNVNAIEVAAAPAVQIGGSNTNVIGLVQSGGTVHQIHTQRHVVKTIAEVNPGAEHISEEQAAELTRLVNQIVETETLLKGRPATHRAVWGALNAHCKVTKYRLIQSIDFDRAKKYLQQWIGRLNSMASAPAKDTDWRSKRFTAIKTRCKKQLGDADAYKPYIKKYFKAESLTDLSTDELQRTYTYIMAKKSV